MNRKEYLFQCLSEEASEVAQATSKVLRFGEDNEWPGYNGTALTRLYTEINDFLGALNMLMDEIPGMRYHLFDVNQIAAKKVKIEKMIEYSKQRGVIK